MRKFKGTVAVLLAIGIAIMWGNLYALAETKRIMVAVQAGAPEPAVYKVFTEEFTKETGIEIEWIDLPQEEQRNKLLINFMGGTGAYDVIALDWPWVAEFADAGFLTSLDDRLEPEVWKDFSAGALSSQSYEGKIYAVPQYAVCEIQYYRTDLFKKYGLREPTLDQPLTWDEWLNDSKKLTIDTDGDGKPDIWGTMIMGKRHMVPATAFLSYLFQNGGNIFGPNGEIVLASSKNIETLQFLVDMVRKYKVAPPGATSFDHVDNHTMFMQGKLGITMNWQYAYSLAKDPATSQVVDKFSVAPPPKKVRSTGMVGAWGLAIPADSKRKDAAWQWIKWITSPTQLYRLRKGSFGPAVRDSELRLLMEDPSFTEEKKTALRVMTKAVAQGVNLSFPKLGQLQEILAEAISEVIGGTKSPEKGLKEAAARFEEIMKE